MTAYAFKTGPDSQGPRTDIKIPGDYGPGNGGESCERRMLKVRDEIIDWIEDDEYVEDHMVKKLVITPRPKNNTKEGRHY